MVLIFGVRARLPSPHAGLVAVCFTALLSGCAALGSRAAPPPAAEAAPAPGPAEPERLPDVDLNSELLFRLVFAEIAQQRGEPGPAYSEFMRVAHDTRDPRVARRAFEVALAAHALPQALEAASLWHSFAPSDPDAEQSYVTLLVANGHYQQARPLLERQLAQSPRPAEVLERLQRLLARSSDPAGGLALLLAVSEPLLAAPASAFETRLVRERAARAAGDRARALEEGRAALALQPESETAVIAVAQLLVEEGAGGEAAAQRAGAHADAARILSEFLGAHPQAAEVRMVYARVLVGADRFEEAQRQFEQLAREAPRNPDPVFALGVLALEAERYEEARAEFLRYLELSAEMPGRDFDAVYLNLERVAEGQRHYEEALDWLHKVHGPDEAPVVHEREAFVLAHLDRMDDGMKLLEQLPADNAEARIRRVLLQGQLLREARRYQQSYELLEQALQANPDDAGLLYESAMSAERLDRIDLMEARLRRLLKLHPDYAHAYNALGYSLADRNIRLQEAYQLIDRALALSPDDGFIIDSMGWVQFRLGKLEAARDSLTRAFQLKADPDVAAHLGEVLWSLGDHERARSLLLEAHRRDSESDTLRETLQRLQIQP